MTSEECLNYIRPSTETIAPVRTLPSPENPQSIKTMILLKNDCVPVAR